MRFGNKELSQSFEHQRLPKILADYPNLDPTKLAALVMNFAATYFSLVDYQDRCISAFRQNNDAMGEINLVAEMQAAWENDVIQFYRQVTLKTKTGLQLEPKQAQALLGSLIGRTHLFVCSNVSYQPIFTDQMLFKNRVKEEPDSTFVNKLSHSAASKSSRALLAVRSLLTQDRAPGQ